MKKIQKNVVYSFIFILGLGMTSCSSGKGSSGCGYWGMQEINEVEKSNEVKTKEVMFYTKIAKES